MTVDTSYAYAPIRQGFGEGVVLAAQHNESVVALCADLTDSVKLTEFKKQFPKRFFEVGITEQNMASAASGMAHMGLVPYITSYAMFSPGRNWEQIRTTICYNDVNVKIVGAHAGVSVGPDGGTHQAIEDIALMRVVPRMTVIVPCDAIEARKATVAMAKTMNPTYLRLAREKTAIITTEDTPFEIGKANVIFDSGAKESDKKVGIIACGTMVFEALQAARALAEEGFEVAVLNMHTIKPLDTESVLTFAQRFGKIITAEEHQVAGGLGSAVAEFLSEVHPTPVHRIGVRDEFGQSGTPEELFKHYGLTAEHIVRKVK